MVIIMQGWTQFFSQFGFARGSHEKTTVGVYKVTMKTAMTADWSQLCVETNCDYQIDSLAQTLKIPAARVLNFTKRKNTNCCY